MPRRLRRDYAGALHHVMSRGIARRTVFETRRDVRYFLSRLAREVRRGELEVLVYGVLTTHFHLFVRSPRGRLSAAMQRVLDAYARWFNRGRRRDGPLFTSRFINRVVESESYAISLVRYIDDNAVAAGLVVRPADYPHGSAGHYARARGPAWLSRSGVEAMANGGRGGPWDPRDYERCFGEPSTPGARWIVGRRLRDTGLRDEDPLDDLLSAAPTEVRDWMERKARLADGTSPGWPVVSPATLRRCVAGAGPDGAAAAAVGRSLVPRRDLILAALLRWCAGLRIEEIGDRMGWSPTATWRRLKVFARACKRDRTLVDEAGDALRRAIEVDYRIRPERRGMGARADRVSEEPWEGAGPDRVEPTPWVKIGSGSVLTPRGSRGPRAGRGTRRSS